MPCEMQDRSISPTKQSREVGSDVTENVLGPGSISRNLGCTVGVRANWDSPQPTLLAPWPRECGDIKKRSRLDGTQMSYPKIGNPIMAEPAISIPSSEASCEGRIAVLFVLFVPTCIPAQTSSWNHRVSSLMLTRRRRSVTFLCHSSRRVGSLEQCF